MDNLHSTANDATDFLSPAPKPAYEPPQITVMNDDEVLSAFQITQAAVSWWVA